MIESDMEDYDIFLVDAEGNYLLTCAVLPPSALDFEDDRSVQIMVETALAYVDVDAAYKVKICGYPGVWIDIRNDEDDSVGTYLYISTEDSMYYLMYLNIEGERGGFPDIIETVAINGQSEGTDLSSRAST